MCKNLQSTCPSFVNISFFAYSRQRKHSIALLTEMPNDIVLVFNTVFDFEVAFENLRKEHLDCSYHATPSIICLNLLDSFAVGKPECGSKHKQKFILIF